MAKLLFDVTSVLFAIPLYNRHNWGTQCHCFDELVMWFTSNNKAVPLNHNHHNNNSVSKKVNKQVNQNLGILTTIAD